MSKVTITLEDKPNGQVEMRCDPSYANMAKWITGRLAQSSAFSMALAIANFVLERQKMIGAGHKKSPLILPALKPGRLH